MPLRSVSQIGTSVRETRKRLGMTQSELAVEMIASGVVVERKLTDQEFVAEIVVDVSGTDDIGVARHGGPPVRNFALRY